jgi:hypothetical protein
MKQIYFTPLCVLTLSGCLTPYQTNFDCPVPVGVPCTSMTKINRMIDKGVLGTEDTPHSNLAGASWDSDKNAKKVYITHFKPKSEPTPEPKAIEVPMGDITIDPHAPLPDAPIALDSSEPPLPSEDAHMEDVSIENAPADSVPMDDAHIGAPVGDIPATNMPLDNTPESQETPETVEDPQDTVAPPVELFTPVEESDLPMKDLQDTQPEAQPESSIQAVPPVDSEAEEDLDALWANPHCSCSNDSYNASTEETHD